MTDEDRCQAETTKRKSALFQPIGGTRGRPHAVRYERCKNKATETIEITHVTLRTPRTRKVRVCKLHKRMHDNDGFLPLRP